MIGEIIQSYRIQEVIDEGGMGVVYRAEHLKLSRQVAIKVMQPHLSNRAELVARFEREAQILESLSHDNIVKLIEYCEDHRGLFIIEEFVDGETLEKYVSHRMGALPEEFITPIFLQILSALDHAHSKGMIHRDIKPSNIMISPGGRVKVLDFGIAKIMGGGSQITTSTRGVGTAAYMSPEQILNKGIDARTDIFSLGIMLFYTATGQHPFPNVISDFELSDSLVRKALPIPQSINPGVTERIANIIRKATQKHPLDRFQNCRAMADAFTIYMKPSSSPSATSGSSDMHRHEHKSAMEIIDDSQNVNRGFRLLALSCLILAVLASIWVFYVRGKPDTPEKVIKYSKSQIENWPEKNRGNLRVGLKISDLSDGVIVVEQAWASEERGGLQVHVRGDSIFEIEYGTENNNIVKTDRKRKETRHQSLTLVGCSDPECACMPGDIFSSREEFFIACMESAFIHGCAISLIDFNQHVGSDFKSCKYCWDCSQPISEYPVDDFYYKAYTKNGYSEGACSCEPCISDKASCLVVYFPRIGGERKLCKPMR